MLCDICIGEEDDDGDGDGIDLLDRPTWVKVDTHDKSVSTVNRIKKRRFSQDRLVDRTNGFVGGHNVGNADGEIELTEIPITTSTNSSDQISMASSDDKEEQHIDSEQDCAIAGIVSMVVMYLICIKRWNKFLDVSTSF